MTAKSTPNQTGSKPSCRMMGPKMGTHSMMIPTQSMKQPRKIRMNCITIIMPHLPNPEPEEHFGNEISSAHHDVEADENVGPENGPHDHGRWI